MSIATEKTHRKSQSHETLTPGQRFGEVIGVIATALVFSYFVTSQVTNTGFFTSAFGPPEMFFFYGPLVLAMLASLTRAFNGRRQPARPVEAAANVFSAVGALWLLIVFPFDFTHLAGALPTNIQFLLGWVTNEIGRFALILDLFVSSIMAFVTVGQFAAHRLPPSAATPPQTHSAV